MFKFFRKILPVILILISLMLPVSLATTTSTLNIGPINSNAQTTTNTTTQNTNNQPNSQSNAQNNTNSSIRSVTETEVPSKGLSIGDIINIFVIAISLVLVFLSIAILIKLNGR